MIGGRFTPGSAPRTRVIERDRLVRRLAGRFEHRLTLVVGAAGFGKTTALATAVEHNRLDPIGDDVWLSAVAADRDVGHFLGDLATAVGAQARTDTELTIAAISDSVWSRAPRPVAIIVDDAHHLRESDSLDAMRMLLDRLPANGSLVLASRDPLDLAVARLRAHGHVLDIGADELAFTDDELRTLADERSSAAGASVPLEGLPRHPATADLRLVAGPGADTEFVWEEILSGLGPDRLRHLQRIAALERVDDTLAAAVTDGAYDAAELFEDLPLVDVGDGEYRVHEIMRTALLDRAEPGTATKSLSIAGETERRRNRLPEAVARFDEAGDPISVLDCARQLTIGPIMSMSATELAEVHRAVARHRPESHLVVVLEAFRRYAASEDRAATSLQHAADAARRAGDHRVEAVCRHRAAQALLLQHQGGYVEEVERIAEIAADDELAAALHAYYVSIAAQLEGDGPAARAALDRIGALDELGPFQSLQVRAEREADLGHPEAVIAGLDRVDHDRLPDSVRQWVGMAMLQCALAPPEVSLPIALATAASASQRGFAHPAAFTSSVATVLAIACGDVAVAVREAARAREHADTGVGPVVDAVVVYAEAALLVERGDEAGAAAMASALADKDAMDRWPSRAELWALPLAYLLRPDRREVLDRADLGPALSAARAAGRALVALRSGDVGPAAELPWERPQLLRVHVPPILLVELACAAADARPDAVEAVRALPRSEELLARLAGREGPAAAVARGMVATVTLPEPFRLRVDLLGPVRVVRSAIDGADPDDSEEAIELGHRPKVVELLGLLTDRGRIDRFEAIARVWPEHDDERKAMASLRTTLNVLNDALDPRRTKGASAFHLRSSGEVLELDARVETDVARFEAAIAAARHDDDNGLPARALEHYRLALDWYRGDFLQGSDAAWAVLPRVRLRALATGAMCRVSELVAARGEPEEAARWADRALALDELDERAMRCLVTALHAGGSSSAARQCAREAAARLERAGVAPSPATARALERFG